MKKITAFFMALFPFLIVGLLFATNLISKGTRDRIVQSLEMKETQLLVRKETKDPAVYDKLKDNVTVIPAAATDPTVYWTSEDEKIASVEKESGKLTCNSFGDVKINAVAKTNSQAKASCKVKVWDDKIHNIVVKNEQQAQFITPNSQFLLDVTTEPAEKLASPTLQYSIAGEGSDVTISQTGLITAGAAANGTFTVTIQPKEDYHGQQSLAKKQFNITVGDKSIDAIGFDNEATEVITTSTYNLYDHIMTSPYGEKGLFKPTDYGYLSSNPNMAKVDETTGEVTFTEQYIPGTPITFTVNLGVLIAQKTVISSMSKHESVSFAKYAYTEQFASFDQPQEITDTTLTAHAYPANTTNDVVLTSSDTSVINIVDNKPYAVKPGRAILTATAPGAIGNVTDSVEVTILKQNDQELFLHSPISLTTENYYPLRKNLNAIFQDRQIKWTQVSATKATLDADDEIVYFQEKGASIEVQAEDAITGKTQKLTISCECDAVKDIDVTSGSATIAAGQKVAFKKNGALIGLKNSVDQLASCSVAGEYVAIHGTTSVDLVFSDDSQMKLTISEPLVSLKTDGKDWNNYVTNATEFTLSSKIVAYPASATYIDATSGAYNPEIEYSVTIDDESSATYDEDTSKLTFLKPYTVSISASAEGITKQFKVTSNCGKFGKFSLSKDATNEAIEFGSEQTIEPGKTLVAKIDEFYCDDATISKEALEAAFKDNVKAVSENDIVTITPKYDSGKGLFEITAKKSGTDIVKISNGKFTFVFKVKVTEEITDVNLYCLGTKFEKNSTITAYEKNATLDIDIDPVSSKKQNLVIEWNGTKSDPTISRKIDLSKFTWKEGEANTLAIWNTSGTKLAQYTINLSTAKPTFTIKDVFGVEPEGGKFSLYATATYATMVIDIGGIATLDYYKNFTSSIAETERYGRYLITPLDAPSRTAYEKEIKISNGETTNTYTMVRDIVSRIELPNHDNTDTDDAKGLQRVHVFGNQTQLAGKTISDTYSLPVNVYDYAGELIEDKTDPSVKNNAIKTLTAPSLINKSGASIGEVKYDETIQCYEIKFDSNSLYTWQEMFANDFVNLTKNQTFNVSTAYGKKHVLADSLAYYSFVVVKGVNVYDQQGIADASKTTDKSIVLQSDFGVSEDPSKPQQGDTPFELTSFNFKEVYGNGHTINFHAITKAIGAGETTVSAKHGFNTNFTGCWTSQFIGLNHKAVAFANDGATTIEEKDKETFAYCTFNNFYQPFTLWCKSGVKTYNHIKNCLFYNDQEYCRNALSISDAGNTTTLENCAFFNAAKIAIMCNKGAVVQLKGNIDVYNFHGSDMFDCMGWSEATKALAWTLALKALEAANAIQGSEYGTLKPKTNAYLFTTIGGSVKFYDHTDAEGKDVFISSEQGSEKAANYLKHATGLWGIIELWVTVKPPLNPLPTIHAPAYFDEFLDSGGLNYETRNILIYRITRW